MLKTLIFDFKFAGHEVITFLDSRLKVLSPLLSSDQIVSISSQEELFKSFREASSSVDAAYVIAPESESRLKSLVKEVESGGGTSLNCAPKTIGAVANKAMLYKELKRKGLIVAETVEVDVNEGLGEVKRTVKELGFPTVFKPAEGAGCSGISLVKNLEQIPLAIKKIKQESTAKYFIIQEFIKGVSASVSLISTGREHLPITLNMQRVKLMPPNMESSYEGGVIPFHHPLRKEALATAKKAVESFKGLKGYVGVDLVLTKEGSVVMEINPRLTTSYVGFRRVVNFNPAQAIIDSVLFGKLPDNVQTFGYAVFLKVKVSRPDLSVLPKTYGLKGVVAPPISLGEDEPAYALLVACSSMLRTAQLRLYNLKKRLLKQISER